MMYSIHLDDNPPSAWGVATHIALIGKHFHLVIAAPQAQRGVAAQPTNIILKFRA